MTKLEYFQNLCEIQDQYIKSEITKEQYLEKSNKLKAQYILSLQQEVNVLKVVQEQDKMFNDFKRYLYDSFS